MARASCAEPAAGEVIDLRSDTVTRPTSAMREAIARADVGDDAFGDDPTVRRLEARVADLLGQERALFFPSGVMANQTAIQLWTEPGTEVVVEATAHVFDWEDGASAQWSGVQLRPVPTPDGRLTAGAVRDALRPSHRYLPRTSLVCVENTHNAAGGRVLPVDVLKRIAGVAREHGLPIHLDGARLWNASVATGEPVSAWAARVDSVTVTLSKGLGCPVGSLLAGPAEVIERMWRIRRRLGGGMRQVGLLAAAGLYALDHHVERIEDDHANARLLARLAAELPGVEAVEPETNIVMLDLVGTRRDADAVLRALEERGVRMSRFGSHRMRAVTHLDVDEAAVRHAAAVLAEAMA